ncbi:collagen binding domain-containing protein, partial [Bacteroidota bacterium]
FYTSQSVTIIAEIPDHPETKLSKSYIFDIIPGNAELNDNYHRFPVKVSTMFITNNRYEKQIFSGMFDIHGAGKISAKKDQIIEFQIRGPSSKVNPLFGINDKYFLKYSGNKSKLIIGDSNYRLSDLTESSRNGLGLGYEYHGKKSIAGGFVNFPRFYPKIKFVTGAYWLQHLSKKTSIKTGVLHKIYNDLDYADLFTLSFKTSPKTWFSLETELAGGVQDKEFNKAFKLISSVRYKTTQSHLTVIHADRDFPGYYNNTQLIATGVSSKLTNWASISANYSTNYATLAVDTLFSNTPFSSNVYFMTNFKINNTSRLSIAYFNRVREARTEPVLFNYTENSVRLSTYNTIKKIGINGFFEYGKVANYLLDTLNQMSNSIQANLMIQYKIKPQVVINGFLNFQKSNKYLSGEYQKFIYGASIVAQPNKSFRFLVSYQNNYDPGEYYRDRSLMNVSTSYMYNNKHEFSLGVRYHLVKNHLNKKEFTAFFKYSYSMSIRAGRLKNFGSFSGQIKNNGVESVEGIIVKLGKKYSITNENGVFEFPQVQEGNYLLKVDESNAELNTIFEEPGPYTVQILSDQNTKIDLSLTKSARIEGKIIIQEDSTGISTGYIQTRKEIKSLYIEAKKGDEIFRIISKKDGTFNFYDLRPGDWNIKIYKTGLPYGYTIEKEEFPIQLSSEEVYPLQIQVIRKSIKIKFQKNEN